MMPAILRAWKSAAAFEPGSSHHQDRDAILKADKVILPGVGSFGDAMGKLRQYGLVEVIEEVVRRGTPFLGICLGLQVVI